MNRSKPPGNALQLDLLIDQKQIEEKLALIAQELETLYQDEELTLVMLLKGSFFLVADLMRHLHLPVRVEAIRCASYGERGMSKGELHIQGIEDIHIEGKHILIVDDIFDTGETLATVYAKLEMLAPASIRSLVLLTKDVPHQTSLRPDFTLFEIEDRFVVGYGLDYKEYYRGLPDIYAINP